MVFSSGTKGQGLDFSQETLNTLGGYQAFLVPHEHSGRGGKVPAREPAIHVPWVVWVLTPVELTVGGRQSERSRGMHLFPG